MNNIGYALKNFIVIGLLVLSLAVFADEATLGKVILFNQNANTPAAKIFQIDYLPKIEETAKKLGAEFVYMDISEGAPEDVAITPLIVYQNFRGRSVFQSRYIYENKLGHFIRTSRFVPQGQSENVRENLLISRDGRSLTGAPIKITDLGGTIPDGFDLAEFRAKSTEAIAFGLEKFKMEPKVELRRTDRLFYIDFHPYRSEDDKIYVSMEIYSQFSCIDPVYTQFDKPISGSFADFEKVFSSGATVLGKEIFRLINESEIGDAFAPIAADAPVKSWEELGLSLPDAPETKVDFDPSKVKLVDDWVIEEQGEYDPPRLLFNFKAPMDSYSGEVKGIAGSLNLGEGLMLGNATGNVVVDAKSLTMGEKSLDDSVHESMIESVKFPDARFTLESVQPNMEKLTFGETAQLICSGTFTLIEKSIPVSVRAQIDPIINEEGQVRLSVVAEFEIQLENNFGIKGPDGPSPANDTIEFHLNFKMKPKE